MRPTDAAAVATALGGLSVRRNEADAAVQSAHTAFESVRQQLEQTRQDCGRLETELTSERQELRDLEVKKAALETVHGTDREAQLRQVADDQDKKQDAVTQTDRRLKAFDPVTVRDDRDRLERTVKVNTEQLNQAGIRKATAEGQLGNARSVDLHGVKASADARLDIRLAPVAPRETIPAMALAIAVVAIGLFPAWLGRISETASTTMAGLPALLAGLQNGGVS
jgi:chromosome segregation ATPase